MAFTACIICEDNPTFDRRAILRKAEAALRGAIENINPNIPMEHQLPFCKRCVEAIGRAANEEKKQVLPS